MVIVSPDKMLVLVVQTVGLVGIMMIGSAALASKTITRNNVNTKNKKASLSGEIIYISSKCLTASL